MKLTTLAAQIAPIQPILRCPQCGAAFTLLENRSLLCENRHCFDLSAKGYVNLAPGHDQSAEKYTAGLFESRNRIFADGFYTPVADALCEILTRRLSTISPPADRMAWAGEPPQAHTAAPSQTQAYAPPLSPTGTPAPAPATDYPQTPVIIDVGCGEGYYSRALSQIALRPTVIGVDLSRDAIVAAARQAPGINWLVGDLTCLPFASATADALVDVLTPADYAEFARVLTPAGLLVKIIPADDYLIEVRRAVAGQLRDGDFSNARVVAHLLAHAQVLEHVTVRHTLPVTPAQAQDFLRMTPMTFGLSQEQLASVRFSEITVAMELFACRMNAPETLTPASR